MAIAEIIAVNLGARLAKILLKMYLQEPVDAIGAELVDIGKGKIANYLDRRAATRQFEGIGESITAQLLPFFEAETLPHELNAEAVIDQLARTLDGNVSAEFFLARDLDPAKLLAELRRNRPLPKGQFSEAEVELYDQSLATAVRYIAEISAKLPRFEIAQVKESLQRLARIEDVVGETARGVKRIEAWVALQESDFESRQYEIDYRLAVGRNLDHLELFGADLTPESRRQALSVAYVSLTLETSSNTGEGEAAVPSSVEAVLTSLTDQAGRLLIRGEAGCGKSTLLRWTAIQAAQGLFSSREKFVSHFTFEELLPAGEFARTSVPAGMILTTPIASGKAALAIKLLKRYRSSGLTLDWRLRLPFLLRLRDCKGGKLPSPDEFPSKIAKEIGSPPTAWVKTVLQSGRGLLLFDGIDEIPNLHRETVRSEIEAIIRAYPKNFFLLSTRPEAVPPDWLGSQKFREARVNPMSELDRSQFIDKWHEAVAIELGRMGRSAEDLPRLSRELKQQLPENPSVARLATNPLLCAMICALHRDRNQKLPESQSDLCESLCQVLLHRRERESGLDLSEFPEPYRKLKYLQKRVIVQEIAHSMVLNGESSISIGRAQEKVADALRSLAGQSPEDAEIVCKALVERSGMLREAKPGYIDFIHNTFKEYLAGDRFANSGDSGLLAQHALDLTWQRVILFAVATERKGFADEVIRRLLGPVIHEPSSMTLRGLRRKENVDKDLLRARHLLALQCRAAALLVAAELEARLDDIAQSIFPPKSMGDAEALAVSGDMVAPFLRYRKELRANEAAACIRALRLIGTSFARGLLQGYIDDRRDKVIAELCQTLNPLSIKVVQEDLIAGRELSEGILSQISDLSPLMNVSGLERLDLSRTQVSDLSPLSDLSSLTSIDISRTQVSDLSPLSSLVNLRALGLAKTHVSDISPLSGLANLQVLDLSGTLVTDLRPLAGLIHLRTLFIATTRISDLGPLVGLSELEGLNFSETQVVDVSVLSKLSHLQWVVMLATKVSDRSPLTNLPNLTIIR